MGGISRLATASQRWPIGRAIVRDDQVEIEHQPVELPARAGTSRRTAPRAPPRHASPRSPPPSPRRADRPARPARRRRASRSFRHRRRAALRRRGGRTTPARVGLSTIGRPISALERLAVEDHARAVALDADLVAALEMDAAELLTAEPAAKPATKAREASRPGRCSIASSCSAPGARRRRSSAAAAAASRASSPSAARSGPAARRSSRTRDLQRRSVRGGRKPPRRRNDRRDQAEQAVSTWLSPLGRPERIDLVRGSRASCRRARRRRGTCRSPAARSPRAAAQRDQLARDDVRHEVGPRELEHPLERLDRIAVGAEIDAR